MDQELHARLLTVVKDVLDRFWRPATVSRESIRIAVAEQIITEVVRACQQPLGDIGKRPVPFTDGTIQIWDRDHAVDIAHLTISEVLTTAGMNATDIGDRNMRDAGRAIIQKLEELVAIRMLNGGVRPPFKSAAFRIAVLDDHLYEAVYFPVDQLDKDPASAIHYEEMRLGGFTVRKASPEVVGRAQRLLGELALKSGNDPAPLLTDSDVPLPVLAFYRQFVIGDYAPKRHTHVAVKPLTTGLEGM